MGVRFLWIDALCICQDDYNDWLSHAVTMAKIYSNSHLTIAATAAKDSRGGLYQKDQKFDSIQISPRENDEELTTVYCRQWIPHWTAPMVHPRRSEWFSLTKEHFPLLTRAWVLQERLLSPRTLHFGAGELVWECCELFTCECNDGICEYPNRSIKINGASLESLNEDRRDVWNRIVGEYSGLEITNPGDWLPALQGIAALLLEGQTHKIVSGLWGHDLIVEMLWCTNNAADRPRKRAAEWRAPTWSWACLEDAAIVPRSRVGTIKEHALIQSLELSEDNTDDRAIVSALSITLSAPVLTGTITYRIPSVCAASQPSAPDCHFRFDNILGDRFDRGTWFHPDWDFHLDKSGIENGTEAYCIFLATIDNGEDDNWPVVDSCLVLIPENGDKTRFQRIGYLHAITYIRKPEGFTPIHRAFDGVEKTTITLI